jgi:DNA-binding XRE family transcriptional regulator
VIPYSEYLQFMERTEGRPDEEVTLPHEVVKMSTIGGMSLIRAWREHLDLTQEEVARRMGISQPAYAKIEGGKSQPRIATCKRLATAMGVEWEQLAE